MEAQISMNRCRSLESQRCRVCLISGRTARELLSAVRSLGLHAETHLLELGPGVGGVLAIEEQEVETRLREDV